MTILVYGRLPVVPVEDILQVIQIVTDWLAKHPEREECLPQIFGHHTWAIRRGHIEEDVRAAAASRTHSYTKLDEPVEP